MNKSRYRTRRPGRTLAAGAALLIVALLALWPAPVAPAGTRDQFPRGAPGFRPNIEWRTSTYGEGQLYRRTLWKVFAQQGEYILLASSAVGAPGTPSEGDILVFDERRVTGPVGRQVVPPTPHFCCRAPRAGRRGDPRARPPRAARAAARSAPPAATRRRVAWAAGPPSPPG